MTDITDDWKPKLASRAKLRWDAKSESYVLLLPEAAVTLQGPASAILQLCDGTRSVSNIMEELATKYPEAAREQIEADVRDFIERFRAKALLEGEP